VQFGGYDPKIVEQSIEERASTRSSDTPDGIYWMEINSMYHW
jgi:hypothetical protein